MSTARKIAVTCSDNNAFEIDEEVGSSFATLKRLMDRGQNGVSMPGITGPIFAKVLEYNMKHGVVNPNAEELNQWDAEFLNVDQHVLFDLILAADYLKHEGLMDFTCKTVAEMMKGKSPEEIRSIFSIKRVYTLQQEAAIRARTPWAFKGHDGQI